MLSFTYTLFCFRVHQLHLQHPSVRKVTKVKGNLKGAQLGTYWSSHSCQNFLYLPMMKMHHQWQCGSKIRRTNCLYHKRKDYRCLDIPLCLFTLLLSWCTKWCHFSYFGVLMAYGGLQDVRFLNYILLACIICVLFYEFILYKKCWFISVPILQFLTEKKDLTITLIRNRILPVYSLDPWSPYLISTANWVIGQLAICLPEVTCFPCFLIPPSHRTCWIKVKASCNMLVLYIIY